MIDLSNVTDIMLGGTPVEQVTDSQGNVLWSAYVDPSTVYFYVEDVSGQDNTLSIKGTSFSPIIEVFKSTDQQNWSSMGTTSFTAITATVPANGKLYLKATANAWSSDTANTTQITTAQNCNVGGNIMSLLYNDNFVSQTTLSTGNTFMYLFNNSTNIVSAKNLVLPATTLADSCYHSMFYGCSSLTTAPALPATTLTDSCYRSMFDKVTSLLTAPALPATTLAANCYRSMFYGTAITQAPALPATTVYDSCYKYMFSHCESLTTTPTLPATNLAASCYERMFDGCTLLNKVITYAYNIASTNCLNRWLNGVAAQGQFFNLGGATYTSGTSGIPSGWTEHNSL